MKFSFKVFAPVYANDLDAYIPELWANESLMILENNLVMGNMVHRDFESQIAQYGDVVNTRQPASFSMKRKVDTDDVTTQDATATNVAVKLNQHGHVSFLIRDGEESKGFKSLVAENLRPAMIAMAQGIDETVMGTMWSFLGNTVGKLGTDPTRATLTALREVMNTNKVPMGDRNLVICPNIEEALLNVDNIITAEKVGDNGTKLREGSLGRIYGFNAVMSQVAPQILSGNTTVTGAVNYGSGYAAGTTTLTVDGLSAAVAAGTWCTIGGDDTPQMVTGSVGGATPTSLTISPGLRYAVSDNAVITLYTPGAVNLAAGYASGWAKSITIDGFSVAPKTGQLISFGTGTERYGALSSPSTTSIDLNDALGSSVADDVKVGIGPAGNYGFAFVKDAVSLVSRPLALPKTGTGALASVVNYNGLSIRAVITYDGKAQGHRVTLDCLYGIKVLNTSLGAVVFG